MKWDQCTEGLIGIDIATAQDIAEVTELSVEHVLMFNYGRYETTCAVMRVVTGTRRSLTTTMQVVQHADDRRSW